MRTSEVETSLSWGMIFLCLFTLIALGRITDPFPFLWPLRLAMVSGGLAAIAWLLSPSSFQEKIPLSIPQVRHILLLLGLALVTIPVSVWPGGSIRAVTEDLWKLILFFLLVCYWCRSLDDARRLTWMCCFGTSVMVLSGILSGETHRDFGGRFAAVTTYDPNDLALLLAMLIPFLIFLLRKSGTASRCLIVAMGLIYLYGIILTQSRGGFLALATVIGVLLYRSNVSPSFKLIIAVGIFLVFSTLAGDEFWDRITTIWNPRSEYDRTAGNRTETWKTGLMIIATRPWGTGYGVCAIAIGTASGGMAGRWLTAHNSFLQVGVELGILGLIAFLRVLRQSFKDLRRVQSFSGSSAERTAQAELASMLQISLYGFLVGGFFLSQAYSMLLFFIVGLTLVLNRLSMPEDHRPSTLNRPYGVAEFAHHQAGVTTMRVSHSVT